MPKVWDEKGFAFSFFSSDRDEPPHIHVRKGGGEAKWWLDPIEEDRSVAFNRKDRSVIRAIIIKRREILLEGWRQHFSQNP